MRTTYYIHLRTTHYTQTQLQIKKSKYTTNSTTSSPYTVIHLYTAVCIP